jgi:hypothetical protein
MLNGAEHAAITFHNRTTAFAVPRNHPPGAYL